MLTACLSCAAPTVLTLERSEADFGVYRTYGFAERLGTDERLYGTLLSEDLKRAATRQLESLGYERAPDPDLLIDFHVVAQERLRERPTETPVFVYSRQDDLTGLVEYDVRFQATLRQTVHVGIVDTRGEWLVWEGTRARWVPRDPAARRELARESLAEILAAYPYAAGEGVPVRPKGSDAFEEYLAQARRGDASAQLLVALMLHGGHGATRDPEEAVRWYRRSAQQGNPLAQRNLGWMQLEGEAVERDEASGVRWLTRAAEQGEPTAQLSLATVLREGRGVGRDDVEAARWTRLAAEQGLAEAQADYGLMCLRGQGTTEDPQEAARWIELAAEQGLPRAQTLLGRMSEHGRGVPRDELEAYVLYSRAARAGDPLAEELRTRLAAQLPPEQLEQARRRAAAPQP
jgi:TPR repeat protein